MYIRLTEFDYKKLILDFFNSKEIIFFIPVVIIFSSLKIYGYANLDE